MAPEYKSKYSSYEDMMREWAEYIFAELAFYQKQTTNGRTEYQVYWYK